ncbi:hypothetical protein KSP39_PZI007384 [Platanthera zijinensis]|uniref:Transposase (putative) gypsy type domain-containing protein n=1 Tax=Platanthera zijinensis TaxID=2320716 RepID=A0AAP0BPG3_9ASPA
MKDSPLLVRLPLSHERINTSTTNQIAVPVDHFDCGFRFPVLMEAVAVFDHYGVVPGQLPPNSIAAIYSFISYLRSERVCFSIKLFRECFSVRSIPDSGTKIFRGHLYFGCRGLKVDNLANKIPNWSERYLIFEGQLGLLLVHPQVRDEAAFGSSGLDDLEKDIFDFFKGERLDIVHYLPLLPTLEDVHVEDNKYQPTELLC